MMGMATFTALSFMGGCTNSNTTDKGHTVKKTDAKTSTATASDARDKGLTLPVLDALFFEEGFEQELKTKLQLTDEQLQKLKATARESVADLTEDGNDLYSGSARNAARRAEEQIRSIVGAEKADQLFRLVNERYAGGDVEGLLPTKPNAVPTDTRIVVNAPAYRMDVYQDGKLLKTYRVGIGYPEFPLPTGMRRAENIIFNPTWTPPDEPWVKGKVQAGKKVAAGSKLNPLGPIKIPIGAPSLIHGGKAVARLGSFASHGCVGMTNAQVQDFAGMLSQLSGAPLTPDSILSYEKSKTKTQSVKLSKAVPVELRYETIVAENGGLRIYRDVYERGTNTLENARTVLGVYGIRYEDLSEPEKTALMQALTEMNRDPQGNPIGAGMDAAADTNGKATDADATSKDGVAASKQDRAKKGKVTRSVVGDKEILVPIARLQGKGYPAPVNFNTGAQPGAAVAGTR